MIVDSLEITSPNRLAEQVEFYRTDAARRLPSDTRSALGQFMTPAPVAAFMATLFRKPPLHTIRLLDPGAGVGSLTAAFVDQVCRDKDCVQTLHATTYEIEELLIPYLDATLKSSRDKCHAAGIDFHYEIIQ